MSDQLIKTNSNLNCISGEENCKKGRNLKIFFPLKINYFICAKDKWSYNVKFQIRRSEFRYQNIL